jgi:hypothetical protein
MTEVRLDNSDFLLKARVVQLFEILRKLPMVMVRRIEICHGLPILTDRKRDYRCLKQPDWESRWRKQKRASNKEPSQGELLR